MNRREAWLAGGAFGLVGRSAHAQSEDGGRSADAPLRPPLSARVPAEDAPHARTFMQWPVDRRVYRDAAFLSWVQETIATVANAIAAFEPVTMLAARTHHGEARRALSDAVELWDVPTNDLWARDSGPIFAVDPTGRLSVAHVRFNGWGGEQVADADALVAERVAERLGVPLTPSGLIGEGGGVEQDGAGALMAHESSWVDERRNPGLTRDQIEERLLRAYGAERMIWAPGLQDQDITDYHIDSLARFTRPGHVLLNLPDPLDRSDPFHAAAVETLSRLRAAGLRTDIIPEPRRPRRRGPEFVASYVNFYVCNGAVIAAQFGDAAADEIAVDALATHFPGREIVTLDVDALGELGGGVHCATQQMPAV